MRLVRWSAAGVACLLVLLAAAAWLVPPMLDWARYRAEIAALASRQVGRAVRIDGPVTLALLPQPTLTAGDVHVDDAGDGSRFAVASLRVRVALGALLAGRVDARELVLRGLDVQLPWPPVASLSGLRSPTWLAAVSASVEGGRLSVGDLVLSSIDAALSTDPLTGTYQAAGTAALSGRTWNFTTRLSQPGADGSASLDVALDGRGSVAGVGLMLSCQIGGDGTLGGQVSARGPDLAQLLPAPHVPFHTEGRITVAAGLAAADDLAVDIGGSPGRGAVALRLNPTPRLDVALATGRLDLDAWLPTLAGGGTPVLPLGIDLSAEAADLAGGVVRRLRGAFDFAASGTEVRELSAVLPGDAELDLAGHVASRRLTGVARLRAPALRTTLGWLQGAGFAGLTTLPPGVLRSAELAGQLRVGGGEIAVAGLDGSVDGAHLSGTLAARMAGRLALSAALRMERLDLDPWLPAALPTPSALGGSLHPFDVDLRLHADHAVAHGLDIAPLTLDAAASNGGLQLRNIAFASSNVRVSASGSIGAGGRLDDARFDLQASEAAPLLAMFATTPPDRAPALLRSPLHLQIAASGAPDAVAARVIADLGDLHAEAEPTVDLAGGRWTGPVALHHAGAPRLAESLGVIGAPAWLGDGSFALLATVAVTPNSVAASDLDLTAGALHATGQLAVDAGGAVPRVTGKLSAERLPLPLPYPRSPDPLPFGLLSGWEGQLAVRADHVLLDGGPFLDDAAAAIGLAAGRLSVDGLTARLAGGAASGRIKLDTQASPPSLAMDARVVGAAVDRLFELPIDLASGRLDGEASLRAAGFSARALLTTLQGSLTMHVADGSIAGLSLPPAGQVLSDSTVLASFAGGTTLFDALDVSAALGPGGILLQRGVLDSPAGAVRIAGAIDPVAQTADLRIVDRPAIADPPEIGLRLTGPLDALQRTPELARLAQWRASRPPLPDTSP